ncbi:MAG TPA: uracil-DNA glycosylase family protein [Phycisphaerae bacterium]|nr:uracil-DNA glycosylase family protein [Phycisphaerae bacterium]HNU46239.1 uracil-DNA glycosylase family protein [Phycisphaerae bacterium]
MAFGLPVAYVYNPLDYARKMHAQYLERYGRGRKEVVLLGMNPGPWGMAQTGVPFGEVSAVRDWLRLDAPVGRPRHEHPRRPVLGLACSRREVSGQRLWGWARDTFGTPPRFFRRFFVANYCPLCFLEAGGRNRTPDKLPADERESLFAACDEALRQLVECLQPRWVIGIGRFAETRAHAALHEVDVAIGRIPHPSPASPTANRNWAAQATAQLTALGIRLSGSARREE